jgi:hypothetical protein
MTENPSAPQGFPADAGSEPRCVCQHLKSQHELIGDDEVLACMVKDCACGPGCIHEGFVDAAGDEVSEPTREALKASRAILDYFVACGIREVSGDVSRYASMIDFASGLPTILGELHAAEERLRQAEEERDDTQQKCTEAFDEAVRQEGRIQGLERENAALRAKLEALRKAAEDALPYIHTMYTARAELIRALASTKEGE